MEGNTDNLTNEGVHLGDMWDRLDAICQDLWKEDRVGAVPLQAVLEEFRGMVVKADQLIISYQKALHDTRRSISSEMDDTYQERLKHLELRVDQLKHEKTDLEDILSKERAREESLTKKLNYMETENIEFKEKFLQAEMDRDAVRAKKMEELFAELVKKEETLETSWQERHAELEAEHLRKGEELRKKNSEHLEGVRRVAQEMEKAYAQSEAEHTTAHEKVRQEMDSRESRCLKWEADLRKKDEASSGVARELENEYQKKRRELDKLKAGMQEQVSAMVKQYQDKAGNQDKKKN